VFSFEHKYIVIFGQDAGVVLNNGYQLSMANVPTKSKVVFISVDPADCADSLYAVNRVVMQLDALPVSTYYGPHSGDYDWKMVRDTIDKCDIFILLVGNSYGMLSDTGESYIHREAVYAKSRNKTVIALLKNAELKSMSDTAMQRLRSLHRLMMSGVFKYWSCKEDILLLARQVLRDKLKPEFSTFSNVEKQDDPDQIQQTISDSLFKLDSYPLTFKAKVYAHGNCHNVELKIEMSWEHSFVSIGTMMTGPVTEDRMRSALQTYTELQYQSEFLDVIQDSHAVDDVRCNEIGFQRLKAYLIGAGVIENVAAGQGGLRNYWQLTFAGENRLQTLLSLA
jgi:multimeric flavodoxin WrbA